MVGLRTKRCRGSLLPRATKTPVNFIRISKNIHKMQNWVDVDEIIPRKSTMVILKNQSPNTPVFDVTYCGTLKHVQTPKEITYSGNTFREKTIELMNTRTSELVAQRD